MIVRVGVLANLLRYPLVQSQAPHDWSWRFHSTSNAINFQKAASNPTSKYQIYLSTSSDPFLNLSIEHYLLQKTPADSTVLFLYVNSPSVVIGRNQNPWLEANLRILGGIPVLGLHHGQIDMEKVQLVRRRSGGGAVFHDFGNVNFSVICPTADFTRDKHAEMVTRAIRKLNPRARVNKRHDIVLDQGSRSEENHPDLKDMHSSPYYPNGKYSPPLKVSGSAYKLIRQRSLHHGTCLLSSPNLEKISTLLNSPAKPFMKARGVDSVRSPVGNIHNVGADGKLGHVHVDMFKFLVVDAFAAMYGIPPSALAPLRTMKQDNPIQTGSECVYGIVGDQLDGLSEIQSGMEELKSPTWIYEQTPQFTVSSHLTPEDPRERPPLSETFPSSAQVYLKVRSGVVTSSDISISSTQNTAQAMIEKVNHALEGQNIHQISSFKELLHNFTRSGNTHDISAISGWLDFVFGKCGP